MHLCSGCLGSGPNDHVFVYFTDHGAPGILAFPNDDVSTASCCGFSVPHSFCLSQIKISESEVMCFYNFTSSFHTSFTVMLLSISKLLGTIPTMKLEVLNLNSNMTELFYCHSTVKESVPVIQQAELTYFKGNFEKT